LQVSLSNITPAGIDGLECIAIHAPRNHQGRSEPFSGGKTYDFIGQAGKSRTGRFSGARYGTLW